MIKIAGKLIIILLITFVGINHSYAKEKWNEYRKLHFIIYYKNAPKDFVKTVEKTADKDFRAISKNLGIHGYQNWSWEKRAKIYIFDNHEEYVTESKVAGWSTGHASFSTKTIRTYPTARGFFDTTLLHELTHIIMGEYMGRHNRKIPPWFHEGVAMQQEMARRYGSHDLVRKAIKDETFMSLGELSGLALRGSTDRDTVDLYYTESASAVSFLIERYGLLRFQRFFTKNKRRTWF